MIGKARFITFEGGEGAGKSTQIRLLADWLRKQGATVCLTREPGGSPGAELIRDLLLKGDVDRWLPISEALMLAAARADHVERTIRPALSRGEWVLCDRFYDSSIAYQGAGRGVGVERVKEIQTIAFGKMQPDLTFILDLPVEVGLSRALEREGAKSDMEDRFERMDRKFHESLRQAFLGIAKQEPVRCILLDADKDIDSLQGEILHALEHRYLKS
ncbi:dTMP kinase [Kordiimonas aestuarii]|uniref:dTMP kinase n=1 Tax=Kordiimonas aestuarii TaxID=1005925 RepID=UPI0021D1EA40|nr:dTMP kinase [Kordiimonas aestuarii]